MPTPAFLLLIELQISDYQNFFFIIFILSLIHSNLLIVNYFKIYSDSVDQNSFTLSTQASDFCLVTFIR